MKISTQTLSSDLTISEVLEITGTLTLDPNKSVTISTSKNIILTGKLIMKPARPDIIHTIRFTGVNETAFVGGGMDPLDSDVGLWVMGSGMLDVMGHEQNCWTRAIGSIKAGSTSVEVEDATGWLVGDEIVVMPTAKGATNYDERKITGIQGNKITVDKAFTDHPQITGFPAPEVLNLTRNVRIEGTPTGRSHILIRSMMPQMISSLALRYMGPRKTQEGFPNSIVSGRYGMHLHHCMDGSRGSMIDCVVVRNSGNHSFVPHDSHGVTFTDCIAYDVLGDAFWYDLGEMTHDLTYEKCVAAKVNYVSRALDMDLWAIDKSDKPPELGANGFFLNRGDGNKIHNCVSVGTTGDPHAKGGYLWPTRDEDNPEGVWEYVDNLSHNCNAGLVVWQNTQLNHTNVGYMAYSNGQDGFHGAYQNNYVYHGGKCNGLFEIKAASADRLRFIDMIFGTVNMLGSALSSQLPLFFLNCKWDSWVDKTDESVHNADIINCEGPISVTGSSSEVVRVQSKAGQAYKLTKSGKVNISQFAPTLWGIGTGLKGEYFTDAGFKNKVLERVDPTINFGDWGNWVHHLCPGPVFSVRWTGKILPQFSEAYSFSTSGGGSMKVIVDGQTITGKINLTAGKLYNLVVEFFNNDTNVRGGANLKWNSPSINLFSPDGEYIPQLQLYPGAVTPPPPPVNIKPTANAGLDAEITLPISEYALNGTGNDSDGTITAYRWSLITNAGEVIVNPNLANTRVTGLKEGVHAFRLTVTDDKGDTASDDVTVTVKPVPVFNQPPSADAGPDTEYILGVELKGRATDIDGTITSVLWELVSGPGAAVILQPTQLETKAMPTVVGTYKFKLTVKDNAGAVVSDEKIVVVR